MCALSKASFTSSALLKLFTSIELIAYSLILNSFNSLIEERITQIIV
jgi:hypothetical protein